MKNFFKLTSLFIVLLNIIFYFWEFYTSLNYDSFLFIDGTNESVWNSRIVIVNLVLFVALIIFIIKSKMIYAYLSLLLSFINDILLFRNDFFSIISFDHYLDVEKLLFLCMLIFTMIVLVICLCYYCFAYKKRNYGNKI